MGFVCYEGGSLITEEHLPLLMLDGYFHTLGVQKGGGFGLRGGLYGVRKPELFMLEYCIIHMGVFSFLIKESRKGRCMDNGYRLVEFYELYFPQLMVANQVLFE